MVLYLAYHFEPEELTEERFLRITRKYFDFQDKTNYFPEGAREFLDFVKQIETHYGLARIRERLSGEKKDELNRVRSSLLGRASMYGVDFLVRGHPLWK